MNKKTHKNKAESNQQEIIFTGFDMAYNGQLVVNREKLHASLGYKRQIEALKKLGETRDKERQQGKTTPSAKSSC